MYRVEILSLKRASEKPIVKSLVTEIREDDSRIWITQFHPATGLNQTTSLLKSNYSVYDIREM